MHLQRYERGAPRATSYVIGKTEKHGTKITFKPDKQIFEDIEFSFDVAVATAARARVPHHGHPHRARRRARRRRKPHLPLRGRRDVVHRVPEQEQGAINEKPVYFDSERDRIGVEVALQYNDGYTETIFTFANNINTREGGTHLIGFKSALTRCSTTTLEEQPVEEAGRERQRGRRPGRA